MRMCACRGTAGFAHVSCLAEQAKILRQEHVHTLRAACNFASSLNRLQRRKEVLALLRRQIPVARRVVGDNDEFTLRMRWIYAHSLYRDDGATLNDIREAVTTFQDTERTARRVLGGQHPLTMGLEDNLQDARAALSARETPPSSEGV